MESSSSAVVRMNVTTLFCCEVSERFCSLQNFSLLSIGMRGRRS